MQRDRGFTLTELGQQLASGLGYPRGVHPWRLELSSDGQLGPTTLVATPMEGPEAYPRDWARAYIRPQIDSDTHRVSQVLATGTHFCFNYDTEVTHFTLTPA